MNSTGRALPQLSKLPLLLCALLSTTAPAAGQVAISAQFGGAIGNHQPAAAGLEAHPGLALGASLEVAASPVLAGYLAYTQSSFRCRAGFCTGGPAHFTSRGASAGVLVRPVSMLQLRAGLVSNRVSIGEAETSAGLGFEVGGGPVFRPADRWEIRPEFLLRRHGGSTGGVDGATTIVNATVGIAFRFGRVGPGPTIHGTRAME